MLPIHETLIANSHKKIKFLALEIILKNKYRQMIWNASRMVLGYKIEIQKKLNMSVVSIMAILALRRD